MKRKPTAISCSIDISGCDLSQATSHEYFATFFQAEITNNTAIEDANNTESLDASRCRLGPIGTSHLLSFLGNSSCPFGRLRRLVLQRNAMGSDGGRAIGRFLDTSYIETLDISLNDIKAGGGEPTATQVLSAALQQHDTKLKELIMDKCALGPEGAKDLAHALHDNKSLLRLELGGNMIGPLGGNVIFNSLEFNSTLQELGLRMNRIGGCSDKFDIQTLAKSLTSGVCHLIKLDLSYNDLRCEGCILLSRALSSQACMLTELLLEKNDIDKNGAVALADALCTNTTLQRLDLKGNNVCDNGAVAIGRMLSCNTALNFMNLSSCSIGNAGGSAIGIGVGQNSSLQELILESNLLGDGDDTSFFLKGISLNNTLTNVRLKGNKFGTTNNMLWDNAIADALGNNSTLCHVDLSNNSLSDSSIVDAIASSTSSITYFDISDNDLEHISIETQLLLAKRMATLEIDMSLNPLSSPPLGRLATHSNLESYLTLLASEKTEVSRIRLMVLGYGGVGKSTFCRAMTASDDAKDTFQTSLNPVSEWKSDRLVHWAEQLGTAWSMDALELIKTECIEGKDLTTLFEESGIDDNVLPSKRLLDLASTNYPKIDCITFAKAIYALSKKSYLSTVGVLKVKDTLKLGTRTCSMIDFAGQVEFLVSHQLLLSSMHTICMIIQPLSSFGKPSHRHFGSWNYWSQFLLKLGDRRKGSLLLAVSQLDKTSVEDSQTYVDNAVKEFSRIRARALGAVSSSNPLMLAYSPDMITNTVSIVKEALSKSLDEVGHSWWVPQSYETLASILQEVLNRKKMNHELPKLTYSELIEEIDGHCNNQCNGSSLLLSKMKNDSNLMQRAISYLEAVGDVMQAGDWLLLDPIGWFSQFLAHFIKDDLACTDVQVDASSLRKQRGTVCLDEIVNALGHNYASPEDHVPEIMSLLCHLEICVALQGKGHDLSYLFPCLLPPLTSSSELLTFSKPRTSTAIRGHRFREVSGFIPPGLFVGLLSRMYHKLKSGTMDPLRMWRDHALLMFNNNKTQVLLKFNSEEATLDVVGWASEKEDLFVGAAKGQQSVVIWIVHLIKIYLRSYVAVTFQESWLCPNPSCHGIDNSLCTAVPCDYVGSEFLLSPSKHARHLSHDCDVEGCWRFLGGGHSLESMKLLPGSIDVCQTCKSEPVFMLRDRID